MLWGRFVVWFGSTCPLKEASLRGPFIDFFPLMKHFYPDGRGLFQDYSAPIHGATGLIEWFVKYGNGVNPSWAPAVCGNQKHQTNKYLLEEWCSSLHYCSRDLMSRHTEAVHWSSSWWPNTFLNHVMLVFLLICHPSIYRVPDYYATCI